MHSLTLITAAASSYIDSNAKVHHALALSCQSHKTTQPCEGLLQVSIQPQGVEREASEGRHHPIKTTNSMIAQGRYSQSRWVQERAQSQRRRTDTEGCRMCIHANDNHLIKNSSMTSSLEPPEPYSNPQSAHSNHANIINDSDIEIVNSDSKHDSQ